MRKLDRVIAFRRASLVDDGLSRVETWAAYGDPVRAQKSEISDAERWRASEVQAHITARFLVRYSEFSRSVTPRDRLTCEGREFDISGIKEVGRRRFLEITAAARVDQ